MHSKKTGGEREEEQIKRRHPPTHIHKNKSNQAEHKRSSREKHHEGRSPAALLTICSIRSHEHQALARLPALARVSQSGARP